MANDDQLQGDTVLVVEDEYFIASDVADELRKAGARVIGPYGDEQQAIASIKGGEPALAVIDINLGAGPSFMLADELASRSIPFIFLTGYERSVIPKEHCGVAKILKPATRGQITLALLDAKQHRDDTDPRSDGHSPSASAGL